MIKNASFQRKVIYLVAMIPILAALAFLGLPATGKVGDPNFRSGGKLARLRTANELSQANLGEIDPAGETMKLATLGLRPVAANILWDKANQYKLTESWDALAATLNQITKLQPNFVTVWEFQAHNMSYNVSVEFDDYRQRYQWVRKGIEFLLVGTQYNKKEPKLPWNLGWFTGQKIGRADEKVQFRRMFRVDREFHEELGQQVAIHGPDAVGPDNLHPDNWRVARLFYLVSLERTDARNERNSNLELWRQTRGQLGGQIAAETAKGRSPLISNADPHMSLINYASAIQEEGRVGEVAQVAWQRAVKEWAEFGRRHIRTTFGHSIQLDSAEEFKAEVARLTEELDGLSPGTRDSLHEQKLAVLTSEERKAHDLKESEFTPANTNEHFQALEKARVTHAEVAERAPENVRGKAHRLAARISELEIFTRHVEQYRSIVNYEYWKARCAAEASDEAVAARKHLYDAQQLYDKAELTTAKGEYEAAWDNWAKVFDAHPLLLTGVTANDLQEPIRRYRAMLEQLGEKFPDDFKLKQIVDIQDARNDAMSNPAPPPGSGTPPGGPPPGSEKPSSP